MRNTDAWIFPDSEQELLLKAILFEKEEALKAWYEWRSSARIDLLDHNSQRLLPMLYEHLNLLGVKDPLLNTFKGLHRKTWYKNQVLLNTLESLLHLFNDSEIPAILLKGSAMTLQYYENQGLRWMDDIDILVPENKALSVIKLLTTSGWTPGSGINPKKIFHENYYSCEKGYHFINPDGVILDLHWHLFKECCYPGADDDFWAESIPYRIGKNINTRILSPTDALFHTIIHAIRWHPCLVLNWVPDAVKIIECSSFIDWSRLIYLAEKRKLLLPLRKGISYIAKLKKPAIPEQFLEELRAVEISSLDKREFIIKSRPPIRVVTCLIIPWFRFNRFKDKLSFPSRIVLFFHFLKFERVGSNLW